MSILRSIRVKLLGIDPAYDCIRLNELPLYQHYFERSLNAIDLRTQTAWSMGRPYDKDQFRRDEQAMEQIIVGEAMPRGLKPAALQVMLNQYFFADVLHRENDRGRWARRVLYRRKLDYFPSASAMLDLLWPADKKVSEGM